MRDLPVSIVLMISMVVVPYEVGFAGQPVPYFDAILDVFVALDAVITLFTVVTVSGQPPIYHLGGIAAVYFKGVLFFDLVTAVPFYRAGDKPELRLLKGTSSTFFLSI